MNQNKFYVTTPIYYGTGAPHLGSLYSTLLADVFARWQRLKGVPVCFLTGTDEHGQKVAQAAHKAGKQPREFVDQFISVYKDIWKQYELSYTIFARTTDHEHIQAVQHWIKVVQQKGDIYKSLYTGWYCTPCETYVGEKTSDQEQAPLCHQCGRETVAVSEECYFFRLSDYQDKLLEFYENNPDFIVPKERFAEVKRFVKDGLRDLSISRTTVTWGVPFPGDEEHVVYVWADALTIYTSSVGYGDPKKRAEFDFWWPADMQVMGKDILRFHAIFWPAFLMAADILPPKQLLVHGWIKVGEQKMSKSFGNVVDPSFLLHTYGADQVRYYLMRQFAITHDGQFSIQDLEQRISDDLANDLGNLVNRLLTLALKHTVTVIQLPRSWSNASMNLQELSVTMIKEVEYAMQDRMIHQALAMIWKFINATNAYFHAQEPWKVAATDQAAFHEIMSAVCHALYTIAILLHPIMPYKMHHLLHSLGHEIKEGHNYVDELQNSSWQHSFSLTLIKPLFEKPITKETIDQQEQTKESFISIDEVSKVELRVGTIVECEPLAKSDKLLKLQVDFGQYGIRQILAGVKQLFSVDDLIGKQAVFVFNLAPRKMLGLESQGMLLIAKDEQGGVAFVRPSSPIVNGSLLG